MKTALITGASGGIGSTLVKKFIDDGCFVLGQYNLGEERIRELKEYLRENNQLDYFFSIKADLNTQDGTRTVCKAVDENFGFVDLLINNAGVDLYKLATDTTEEDFDEVMNVNFKASFMLSKHVLRSMIARERGKIIFVSSIWGIAGACMESVYSASKSALSGLAKSLAKEVGRSNITVNCVAPGVINTPMNGCFNEQEISELISKTPLNRLGMPEEVADLVMFLASDRANFITGQTITVDGGFIL